VRSRSCSRQIDAAEGGDVAVGDAALSLFASASSEGNRVILWRTVLGAFQLTIPVKTKQILLADEERMLSVLRWICGFRLDTEDGERQLAAREHAVEDVVTRAWRDRILVAVAANARPPHRVESIVLLHAPRPGQS
jgi:hypothetical protein